MSSDTNITKKLVLVHEKLHNDEIFMGSFKDDCIIVEVTDNVDISDIHEIIDDEVYPIDRLAFVYHYNRKGFLDFFYNDYTFDISAEEVTIETVVYPDEIPDENNKEIVSSTVTKYHNILENNYKYKFLSDDVLGIIQKLNSKLEDKLIVDVLTCNLNQYDMKNEIRQIEQDENINIQYSVDQTGNNPQGNWVLESDNVNIKDIYFSENINEWDGLLTELYTITNPNSAGGKTYTLNQNVYIHELDFLTNTNLSDFTAGIDPSTYTERFGFSSYSQEAEYYKGIYLEDNDIFDGSGFSIDYNGFTNIKGLFFIKNGITGSNTATVDNPQGIPIIKNLTITNGSIDNYKYVVNNGVVTFDRITVYSGSAFIIRDGGNYSNSSMILYNCVNECNIPSSYCGVFLPYYTIYNDNLYIRLENCINKAPSFSYYVGMLGTSTIIQHTSSMDIIGCVNHSNLTRTGAGGIFGGGGGYDGTTGPINGNRINIINCINYGNFLNPLCGGIFGNDSFITNGINIENFINYGEVINDAGATSNGFIGSIINNTVKNIIYINTTGATMTNCFTVKSNNYNDSIKKYNNFTYTNVSYIENTDTSYTLKDISNDNTLQDSTLNGSGLTFNRTISQYPTLDYFNYNTSQTINNISINETASNETAFTININQIDISSSIPTHNPLKTDLSNVKFIVNIDGTYSSTDLKIEGDSFSPHANGESNNNGQYNLKASRPGNATSNIAFTISGLNQYTDGDNVPSINIGVKDVDTNVDAYYLLKTVTVSLVNIEEQIEWKNVSRNIPLNEDGETSFTISLNDLSSNRTITSLDELGFNIDTTNTNTDLVSININGNLVTISGVANQNGSTSFGLTVNYGASTSTQTVIVTINAQPDPIEWKTTTSYSANLDKNGNTTQTVSLLDLSCADITSGDLTLSGLTFNYSNISNNKITVSNNNNPNVYTIQGINNQVGDSSFNIDVTYNGVTISKSVSVTITYVGSPIYWNTNRLDYITIDEDSTNNTYQLALTDFSCVDICNQVQNISDLQFRITNIGDSELISASISNSGLLTLSQGSVANKNGNTTFDLIVNNTDSQSATKTINVTVTAIDDDVAWNYSGDGSQTINENTTTLTSITVLNISQSDLTCYDFSTGLNISGLQFSINLQGNNNTIIGITGSVTNQTLENDLMTLTYSLSTTNLTINVTPKLHRNSTNTPDQGLITIGVRRNNNDSYETITKTITVSEVNSNPEFRDTDNLQTHITTSSTNLTIENSVTIDFAQFMYDVETDTNYGTITGKTLQITGINALSGLTISTVDNQPTKLVFSVTSVDTFTFNLQLTDNNSGSVTSGEYSITASSGTALSNSNIETLYSNNTFGIQNVFNNSDNKYTLKQNWYYKNFLLENGIEEGGLTQNFAIPLVTNTIIDGDGYYLDLQNVETKGLFSNTNTDNNNIVIQNLNIINANVSDNFSILLSGGSHNITIKNCTINGNIINTNYSGTAFFNNTCTSCHLINCNSTFNNIGSTFHPLATLHSSSTASNYYSLIKKHTGTTDITILSNNGFIAYIDSNNNLIHKQI